MVRQFQTARAHQLGGQRFPTFRTHGWGHGTSCPCRGRCSCRPFGDRRSQRPVSNRLAQRGVHPRQPSALMMGLQGMAVPKDPGP